MKKLMLSAIAFVVITGSAAVVSAQTEQNVKIAAEKKEMKFKNIENFQENVHKANQLKIEQLELKKQIVQKRDQLFDLHMKVNKNEASNKNNERSAFRQDMKQIHQDLRALRKESHETKKAMREAMKAKNMKLVSEKIQQSLAINEKINNKLKEKVAKLDEIIAQHQ
ncbi:hypothetical protein [Fictibacillus barbaricus]|uniref:ABC-type phosphate transport system auxiliary subunit n=1 Tax=Fictibacillus barbaricus TaxID=182136 RepID=A0ABU1U3K3_9BACL|nr:hypothetical protein [Fictibacillus barbaricus]MDR7073956.1 ABC-type phosphate transport system auxiliary subunit [Fictibacillus barbaricus]